MKLYDFSYGLKDTVINPKSSWTVWKSVLEVCEKRKDLDLVWESKKQFIKGGHDCYSFNVYIYPSERVCPSGDVQYDGVCFCAPPYNLNEIRHWPWNLVVTEECAEVLKEIGVITEKVSEEA